MNGIFQWSFSKIEEEINTDKFLLVTIMILLIWIEAKYLFLQKIK